MLGQCSATPDHAAQKALPLRYSPPAQLEKGKRLKRAGDRTESIGLFAQEGRNIQIIHTA